MTNLALVGLDVGYSARKRTSGVAAFRNGELRVQRTDATAVARQAVWGFVHTAHVVAIDAPVLPDHSSGIRTCERALASGLFQRRCKPGFSHVAGTGLNLRAAGATAAAQLTPILSREGSQPFPQVTGRRNVVEAFPNTFLGVCLPETEYQTMPRLRRGRKFDWLYDAWRSRRLFSSLQQSVHDHPDVSAITQACDTCRDHEERAALVCLLTAACVALGRYAAAGEASGGYFFLPPLDLWQSWATTALDSQRTRFVPPLQLWSNGQLLNAATSDSS